MPSLPAMPGTEPEFVLRVGSEKFTGWVEVTIEKSLDQFAHLFTLRYCDRWTLEGEPWQIFPGENCILLYGRQVLITGYITETDHVMSGNTYDLSASGRSLTCDLVDCSAIYKTGQWKNQTLLQIVKDLCDPFGLGVEDRASISRKFKRFELEDGETAFDAIDRACRIRACMPITTTEGGVAIVRSDTATPVTEGGLTLNVGLAGEAFDLNIVKQRQLHHSEADRYSDYIFKGQTGADAEFFSHNATTQKGTAQDASITRYRPLLIMSEGSGDKADLGERALWERNMRASKSDRVTYTVDGLTDPNGLVWEPGKRYKVKDDLLKINKTLLVSSVQFSLGSEGLTSVLELISPESFSMLELPERGNAWNPR